MKVRTNFFPILAAVFVSFGFAEIAKADLTSPRIQGSDQEYSGEKPNTEQYGTGVSGRKAEASTLRFEGERDVDDGQYEAALKKLSKAVELDATDPASHVLYARALSGRIKNQIRARGIADPDDITTCMREWKMIVYHDIDAVDQEEARLQLATLQRLHKQIAKGKKATGFARLAEHHGSL